MQQEGWTDGRMDGWTEGMKDSHPEMEVKAAEESELVSRQRKAGGEERAE